MIKVIGGKLKNKNILTPQTNVTIPTKNRVREAMFSIIQNYIKDSIILDLFSGSGALAIESYSRGAKFIYLNDLNKDSFNIIKKNMQNLNIFDFDLKQLDYLNYLYYAKDKNLKFDIIFLDPPYDLKDSYLNVIKYCLNNDLLKDKSIFILESNDKLNLDEIRNKFILIKEYSYGYTKVYLLKR